MATQPKVNVDQKLCIGSGECVALAPDAFSLEASNLTVTVLAAASRVGLELLEDAAMSCPTGAIHIAFGESR